MIPTAQMQLLNRMLTRDGDLKQHPFIWKNRVHTSESRIQRDIVRMGVNFIDVGEMMFGHSWQLKEFVTFRPVLFRIKAFDSPTSRFATYVTMNHVFENPSTEALNDRNGTVVPILRKSFNLSNSALRTSSQTHFSMNSLAQIALHLRSCSSMFHPHIVRGV